MDEETSSKKLGNDLTVIIPAFNEGDAINSVINQIILQIPEAEVIVVDDGSTDNTYSEASKTSAIIKQHPRNLGYGAAWKTGALAATRPLVLFFDGDGQFQPKDAMTVYREIADGPFDAILCVRDRDSQIPISRRPGKLALKLFAQLLVGQKIPDLNCGLRAFRREVLLRYLHILPDGFSATTTTTLILLKRKYRISFISICTFKRIGRSSVKIFKDGFNTALNMLRLVALLDPLRIFIPTAVVLILLSIVYSGYEAFHKGLGVPVLGATLFLFGIITFFMGLLCDQIASLRLERFEY